MRTILNIATPVVIALALAACSEKPKEPTQRDKIGQNWKYEGGEGASAKVAYIGSVNSVATMTAPDTFSVLLVQPLKDGDADVTVKLVGAPFTCDLSDCRITAVSDDGKTHEWKGRMATNDDGIALPPSQGAYDVIRKSKTLKVNLIVGKDQTFPFQFNLEGLTLS